MRYTQKRVIYHFQMRSNIQKHDIFYSKNSHMSILNIDKTRICIYYNPKGTQQTTINERKIDMTERTNVTQVMEYGRLMGISELMRYTSLGRNTAMELGKNSNAIVRIGKRVLYDRRKIDQYIDEQAQDR